MKAFLNVETSLTGRRWVGPDDALIWGRLSAEVGHDGADLMIAATALSRDAVVVTGNVADFLPTGVRLENPF